MNITQPNIEKLKTLYNEGMSDLEISKDLNLSRSTIQKYRTKLNIPKNITKPKKHSQETKQILSEKRKQWLKCNPDKHPWRNKDKFQSKPCEKVKEYLKSKNIQFVEEYNPEIENRFFSIDIALPDKRIALEINGNQHYDKDGKLKPYYQERHDLLCSHGWIVFEIHYSHCFNMEKWDNFSDTIIKESKKSDFDYFNHVPEKKLEKQTEKYKPVIYKTNTCQCGQKIHINAKNCISCYNLNRRKVKNRPSLEELNLLIGKYPIVQIGKMYGVSDNSIRKWLKQEKQKTNSHKEN